MDILNFISWIRGGRKFTNVDPATTLVPVGVRDNSRDDKYLTGGISVEDLAAQIGGGGGGSIEIPKVITKPLQGTIQTQLDFYQTTEWQQHNPKLFLFTQRSKKKKKVNNTSIMTGSGFVHTAHLDGNFTKFGGGAQAYTTDGQLPIIRHTEFTLPTYTPYAKFLLSDLGLDALEWVTVVENTTPSCLDRVYIYTETTDGSIAGDYDAVGIANGKPYYQFDAEGPSGPVNYTLYWDTIYNWSAAPTSSFGAGDEDIISNVTGDCPVSGGGWTIVNNSGQATFIAFSVNTVEATFLRRQSVASDYVSFNPQQIGGDTNDLGYYFQISGKIRKSGYRELSCPDACINVISSIGLSSQKQKFKVAIVIDNPNPTPDAPYLIGPMSDTFVLRFANEAEPKFTTDNISRVVIT
jgi:hypothetical protein